MVEMEGHTVGVGVEMAQELILEGSVVLVPLPTVRMELRMVDQGVLEVEPIMGGQDPVVVVAEVVSLEV
jgi:hypothetical protein